MEIKMILAMTVREFDVCGVYAEWDQVNRRGQRNVKSVEGERAYQIQLGSAHPSDAFPCRVTWAEHSGSNGMA